MGKVYYCKWCSVKLTGRHRAWCSTECRDKGYMETHPSHRRWMVWHRDKGFCSSCGLDTERIYKLTVRLHRMACMSWQECDDKNKAAYRRSKRARNRADRVDAWLCANGFGQCVRHHFSAGCDGLSRSLWEHDHVLPLKEGGSNQLDNLRTLCVPCHRDVTKRYSRFRAHRKKGGLATYRP